MLRSQADVEFAIVSPEPWQWIIAAVDADCTAVVLPGEYLTADAARDALPAVSRDWLLARFKVN